MIGIKAFDVVTEKLFILHAYLIVNLGDIPAISLLMRMKGHNAISPCRMCKIVGVKGPSSKTNYVPLDHRSVSEQSSTLYDPSNLPMRTHEGFMDEAFQVQFAETMTVEKELAMKFGIKGIPLLSSLSSLSFPLSFPYNFMHLI